MNDFFTLYCDVLIEHFRKRRDKNKGFDVFINALSRAKQNNTLNQFIDDPLCQSLVSSIFPNSMIELFGGYKRFISLSPLDPNCFPEHEPKYMILSDKQIPDHENIAIGLSTSSLRPVIALRLIQTISNQNGQSQEQEICICYHSRYSFQNVRSNWVRGQQPNSVATLTDLPEVNRLDLSHEFRDLQRLIQGESLSDWQGNGITYRLAPSREEYLLEKENRQLRQMLLEQGKKLHKLQLDRLLQAEFNQRARLEQHQSQLHDRASIIPKLVGIPGTETIVAEQIGVVCSQLAFFSKKYAASATPTKPMAGGGAAATLPVNLMDSEDTMITARDALDAPSELKP